MKMDQAGFDFMDDSLVLQPSPALQEKTAAALSSDTTYLIACHCDPANTGPIIMPYIRPHELLYINGISLEDESIRDRIHYIDTKCIPNERSFKNWNNIPRNSIDIIWAVFCPIASLLFFNRTDICEDLLIALFETSWNILKENGSIIIPVPTSFTDRSDSTKQISVVPAQVETNLRTYLATNSRLPWTIQIIESKDYSFYIKKKENLPFKYLLIVSKTTAPSQEPAAAKTRKTRKRLRQ